MRSLFNLGPALIAGMKFLIVSLNYKDHQYALIWQIKISCIQDESQICESGEANGLQINGNKWIDWRAQHFDVANQIV